MDPLAGVPAAGKSSSSRIWSTRHVDTPTLELSMLSDSTRSDGLPLLTVTATWPRPNVCLVRPVGELDIATAPELASTLRAQTSSSPVHLILDLSEVSLLAATGVSGKRRRANTQRLISARTAALSNRRVSRVTRGFAADSSGTTPR